MTFDLSGFSLNLLLLSFTKSLLKQHAHGTHQFLRHFVLNLVKVTTRLTKIIKLGQSVFPSNKNQWVEIRRTMQASCLVKKNQALLGALYFVRWRRILLETKLIFCMFLAGWNRRFSKTYSTKYSCLILTPLVRDVLPAKMDVRIISGQ
jgi:hypothetical protein